MRIASIEIERFRRIARARISLGPGLNVLHGRNDLGKSTIAEALRAAFLVQTGSVEARSYVPWTSGGAPSITVVFEAEGKTYRLAKTFGIGRGCGTRLEEGAGPDLFVARAEGRAADDKVRSILGWGLPSLGGRGRSRNDSFLTSALLAEQGDVANILTASLEADATDSGKALITRALGAIAQDPLVARMIARLETRIGQVYTEAGRLRQAEDSPLVALGLKIKERRALLAKLEADRDAAAAVAGSVASHRDHHDGLSIEAGTASERLAVLRARQTAWKSRIALDEEISRWGAELERVATAEAVVAQGEAALHELDKKREDAQTKAKEARREAEAVEAGLGAARERHEDIRRALESARAVASEAAAKRQIQLEGRIAECDRRIDAAERVEQARVRAAQLACVAVTSREEADRCEAEAERAGAVAEIAVAAAALAAAEAKAQIAGAAKSNLDAANSAADGAAGRCADLTTQHERARATFEIAREAHEKQALGDNRRNAEIQSARTRLLEIERDQSRAAEWLDRATAASLKIAVLNAAEKELDAKRQELENLVQEIEESDRQIAVARESIESIEAALLRRAAREARVRADALARQWADQEALRAKWQSCRTLGQAAFERSERRVTIAAASLASFHNIAQARGKTATPHPPSSSPALPAAVAITAGAIAGLVVAQAGQQGIVPWISGLVIAAVVFVTVHMLQRRAAFRKAEADAAAKKAAVEERWLAEVEPILREAGVADVERLEAYRVETEALKCEAVRLRSEAEALEIELGGMALHRGDVEAARAQAEAAERQAAIVVAAASPATRLGDVEMDQVHLDRARREKESRDGLRARLVESRNALQPSVNGLEGQVRVMGEELALARSALEGDPERDREAWESRRDSAARAREETEASIKAVAETSAKDADAIRSAFNQRKVELEAATEALRSAEEARGKAREAAAEKRAQWESSAAAAEEAGAAVWRARLKALREQHPATGEGPLPAEDEAREAAETARAAVEEAIRKLRADRAVAERTGADAAQLEAELGSPAGDVKAATEYERALAVQELSAAGADAATAIATLADEERDAATDLARTAVERDQAKERLAERESPLAGIVGEVERIKGEVAASRRALEGTDRARATAALGAAIQARANVANAEEVNEGTLATAEAECARLDGELAKVAIALHSAQGQLQLLGGAVIAERCADERDVLQRLEARSRDLEEEVAAQRLLLDTLKRKEEVRASNLGSVLARPITERFVAFAGSRYSQIRIGPYLRAETIEAVGEPRGFDLLSVGTREQLATLMRLAVATHLKTAIVLDDQLVHSDSSRMGWFRDELRRCAANGTQIVVLTCRPADYVDTRAESMTDQGENGAELVVLDLEEQLAHRADDLNQAAINSGG